MKYLLICMLIGFPCLAFSQNILDSIPFDTSGYAKYEGVTETTGLKNNLFGKGKAWFASTFKDAALAIESEDKEDGTLVGEGNFTYSFTYINQTKKNKIISYPAKGKATFAMNLFFKDDKFKYVINNIKISNDLSYFTSDAAFYKPTVAAALTGNEAVASTNLYRGLNDAFQNLIASLQKAMTTKTDSDF